MFKKVLVANRGEIAVRVLRACKELGILTVTVYSDADRNALHTRYADEAYKIGPPPATESYLRIDKIIEVAERSGAEAIHPGYGFLAENAQFAEACESAGIIFVGPSSKAIRLLGDKIEARRTMEAAGIPVIPGSGGELSSEAQAIEVAAQIGFPLLIKAAGGGGGKGMRIVRRRGELAAAIRQATSEAGSAFGNPTVYMERYLASPRHIEFQILADTHGNAIHLGERECSIQRRYQKLVEESPSPIMTAELREEMGRIALRAVRASGYTNAGTVEFMVDPQRRFYFLEMNTRLQVEHPVTELVTGVDIVREQLKISSGQPLSLRQEEVRLWGAAIECRIAAEDPANNFMPSMGRIIELAEPGGLGVRVDSGVFAGFEVPVYYDPLIAKLLVWAPTRDEAISRMGRALSEYKIRGIKTGIPFHQKVMRNPYFTKGEYDTTFVEKLLGATKEERRNQRIAAIAAVIADTWRGEGGLSPGRTPKGGYSLWKLAARQAGLRRT